MNKKSILEVFGEKSQDADELVAHTLQSIANMNRGEWEDILYKIETKGGEDRFIHRGVSGLPTQERREWDANMLRAKIQQDPTFADTLSYKEGMGKLAPQESISSKLLKALGIYEDGGTVEEDTNFLGNIMGMFKDFGTKRKIKKSGKEFDRLSEDYADAEGTLTDFLSNSGIIEHGGKGKNMWVRYNEDLLQEKLKDSESFADIYNQLYSNEYEAKTRMEQSRKDYEALQKLLENN